MKINFLGDSITAGAWLKSEEERYTFLLCKKLGATENNYGISATRIARQKKPSENKSFDQDFLSRVNGLDSSADFTFVFGGTNDYGHGDASLCDIDDKTPYTFYGAMNILTERLIEMFGKNKICYILPLPRYNEDDRHGDNGSKKEGGNTLSEYREAIRKVAKRFDIDVLDLSDIFPRPQAAAADELTADGLHPNPKGHRMIADRLYEYLKGKISL
mgnify:FL=1